MNTNPKKLAFLLVVLTTCFSNASKIIAQATTEKERTEKAMIRALEWQEQHPIFALAPTDWTNGAYYVGVAKAHQATENQFFEAALKTMGYTNQWKPLHRTYHADDIAISYSYLYTNTLRKDLVDLGPTKEFLDTHLYQPNMWKDAKADKEFKKILWWWCDALFMAPPVITLYAKQTGEKKYLETMYEYYKETYDLLYDKEEQLFARDTRFQWGVNEKDLKEENGKKIFWARGNGWVIGGLALILTDLPKENKHYDFYLGLYKEMAARVLELQHEDGLWRTSLLSPESFNHGEVSASGFFTYALAWGINTGILDKTLYTPAVTKAWKLSLIHI